MIKSQDELSRACSTHGGEEERIYGFGGKAGRKRLLEKPRRRWEDSIKMDLKELI
jgi:hypothetical protein